ncbi:hypothetical protein [Nocardia sp. NPDC051463]
MPRAHEAGALRADVTSADVLLLIEQLGKSALVEQFEVRAVRPRSSP